MMRGRRNSQGPSGMRSLMERLRQRREQQLGRYDLSSFMEEIDQKLKDIVEQERGGIDRLRDSAGPQSGADQSMLDMVCSASSSATCSKDLRACRPRTWGRSARWSRSSTSY
jgi:hypothetical protein